MSYNKKKEESEPKDEKKKDEPSWNPSNPHDRCCKATAFNEAYAPDFLKNYGDPILNKYLDLDNLHQAPTVQLTKELKEINLDASLATRLSDASNEVEVLLHLEHKSQPSTAALIQLLFEAALTIFARWEKAGRPEKGFTPPIILMIIVYNEADEWVDELAFLDFFKNLPPEFLRYLIQFYPIVINLRRFDYDNLPGELYTQAYVESLMRATDGTFNEHLPGIMWKIAQSKLSESGQEDLVYKLAVYNTSTTKAKPAKILEAISTAFKKLELEKGINMAEKIQETLYDEGIEKGIEIGIEIGEERREIKEKSEAILTVLETRFKQVPQEVSDAVFQMKDPTALKSHLSFAVMCTSIEEFSNSLK